MNAIAARSSRVQRSRRAAPAGPVVDLTRARIERALRQRSRYRYVQPRVEPEGAGWRIVSPNCSRKVDPAGGDIAIAWLVPGPPGQWRLHAHDDARGGWMLRASSLTLAQALDRVCADPAREYWR